MASWVKCWNLNTGVACWKPLGGSKIDSSLSTVDQTSTANFWRLSDKIYLVIVTQHPWGNWIPSIKKRQKASICDVPTNANLFIWRKWSSYSNWQLLILKNVPRRTVQENSRIHNILNNKFKSIIIISIFPSYSWITTLVYLIIKTYQNY